MTTKYRDPMSGKVVLDEIQEPLYYAIDIANGESLLRSRVYFSAPQGLGESMTNLQQPNMLTKSQSFRCIGIGFDAQNMYAANDHVLPYLLNYSSLVFTVDQKDYWKSSLMFIAGRMSASYAVAQTNNLTTQHFHMKTGKPAGYINMTGDAAVNIEELTNFSVTVTTSGLSAQEDAAATVSSGVGTKIRTIVSLHGYRRRPLQ